MATPNDMPHRVLKNWGYEVWFENNDKYCGKKLFIRKDVWSSGGLFHYHKIKDETFYVISGTMRLDYVETDTGQFRSILMSEGGSIRIKPFVKHRFTGVTDPGCIFIEVSTTHSDSDSYRCYWDGEKWDDKNSGFETS